MVAKLQKRFRFTIEKLESLPAPAKVSVYYDSDVRQLGVRVQPTGKKSFFVLKQANGRPQRKTLGPVGELKLDAARELAHGLLHQLAKWKADGAAGLSPLARPEKGFTFSDALESYAKGLHAARERKPIKDPAAAEARIRWRANRYLAPIMASPVEQITGSRLESLHRSIGDNHGKIAANRAIELARAIFRHAIKKGLLAGPLPTASVERYAETKRERFLQPDELVRVYQALEAEPNADLRDFVLLLLATGVRKSSLYAARFEQISEPFQVWNLPTSKNGSPLIIQLTPRALAIFETRRKRIGDASPWVFPSATSRCGHVMDYQRQFERLRKAAGIANFTTHDLRRTAASYMAISGASLPIIGSALGHKSLDSTAIYARLHGSAVRQSLLAGEEIQKQMMDKARKQLKAAARRQQKSLPAASV
jgi:integrase